MASALLPLRVPWSRLAPLLPRRKRAVPIDDVSLASSARPLVAACAAPTLAKARRADRWRQPCFLCASLGRGLRRSYPGESTPLRRRTTALSYLRVPRSRLTPLLQSEHSPPEGSPRQTFIPRKRQAARRRPVDTSIPIRIPIHQKPQVQFTDTALQA